MSAPGEALAHLLAVGRAIIAGMEAGQRPDWDLLHALRAALTAYDAAGAADLPPVASPLEAAPAEGAPPAPAPAAPPTAEHPTTLDDLAGAVWVATLPAAPPAKDIDGASA